MAVEVDGVVRPVGPAGQGHRQHRGAPDPSSHRGGRPPGDLGGAGGAGQVVGLGRPAEGLRRIRRPMSWCMGRAAVSAGRRRGMGRAMRPRGCRWSVSSGTGRRRPSPRRSTRRRPSTPVRSRPSDSHTPFDAVIGNVPFGQIVPNDRRYNRGRLRLHNYFLAKSVQLVRPGGVVLTLTSVYTLDARNPAARRALGQHADLIGAVRLPNRSMSAIAGTDVILDLLVLRRRPDGATPAGAVGWDQTVEVEALDETGEATSVRTNRYFADHPEHVLGTTMAGRGIYRDGEMMVRSDLTNLPVQAEDALAGIAASSRLRHEPTTIAPEAPVHSRGSRGAADGRRCRAPGRPCCSAAPGQLRRLPGRCPLSPASR